MAEIVVHRRAIVAEGGVAMRALLAVSLLCLVLTVAGADFPRPENLATVAAYCGLDEAGVQALLRQGFVVSGHSGSRSLAGYYLATRERDVPIFITCDAMLQAWPQARRGAEAELKRKVLRPQLIQLVDGLLAATQKLRAEGDDALLRANALMLATTRRLLEPLWDAPEELAAEVGAEAARVARCVAAEGEGGEDYSAYAVPDSYHAAPDLAAYFRGSTYLARHCLRVADSDAPEEARAELQRAALDRKSVV
jgi:hypothetical protein